MSDQRWLAPWSYATARPAGGAGTQDCPEMPLRDELRNRRLNATAELTATTDLVDVAIEVGATRGTIAPGASTANASLLVEPIHAPAVVEIWTDGDAGRQCVRLALRDTPEPQVFDLPRSGVTLIEVLIVEVHDVPWARAPLVGMRQIQFGTRS